MVILEESWLSLSLEDLSASKDALFNDIHTVTLFTLTDKCIARFTLDLFDRVNNNLVLFLIKRIKHKDLEKSFVEPLSRFSTLSDNLRLEVTLLIP